jgi:hypothetical protein
MSVSTELLITSSWHNLIIHKFLFMNRKITPHLFSVLKVLLVGLLVLNTSWGQTQNNITLEQPVTTLVEASTESIAAPYPTKDDLPKTISFDAMTEMEMQQWRQDMFDWNIRVSGGRVGGGSSCTQWYLLRLEPNKPWKTIGVGGLMKINGMFRTVQMSYAIEPGKSRWVAGKQAPGKEPGTGIGYVEIFKKNQTSFIEKLNEQEFDKKTGPETSTYNKTSAVIQSFRRGELGANARGFYFGSTALLTISDKKMKCTHVKAHCRRYVFPFTNGSWRGLQNELRESISFPPEVSYEMAIEDMCPFDRGGLVQREINTRLGGPGPGVRNYGLPNNTHLTDAIRPYLDGVKK